VDGKVVTDLLEPVIGKPGQVRLVFQGLSTRWALSDEKHPMLSVRLRSDGLLEDRVRPGWCTGTQLSITGAKSML